MTMRGSHKPSGQPGDPTIDIDVLPPLVSSKAESRGLRIGRWILSWVVIRRALIALYIGSTVFVLVKTGIPTDREILAGWSVGLALIPTLGRRRREAIIVVLSWLPFLAALFLYDFARAAGYWLYRNRESQPFSVTPQIRVDRFLGGGRLWTERLQEWLVSDLKDLRARTTVCNAGRLYRDPKAVRWYDVGVAVVYTSHFFVPYLAAGYLWRKGQRVWRWYAGSFVVVNLIACIIFALVATAPPWYAACQGLIEQFPRGLNNHGFRRVGLSFASRVIDKGKGTVNPYAAIPSLHSSNALLVTVFAWSFMHKRLRFVARPILALFPLAMGFALVYSGEHYLVDVLSAFGLVAVVLGAGALLRRRKGWRSPWTDGPSFKD